MSVAADAALEGKKALRILQAGVVTALKHMHDEFSVFRRCTNANGCQHMLAPWHVCLTHTRSPPRNLSAFK